MKYVSVILMCFFLSFSNHSIAQKKIVEGICITGSIKDSVTNKPIKNVTITISGSNKKTCSNKRGEFRLILFSKPDSIFYYHKKYETKNMKLKTLNNDLVLRKKD